VPRTQLQSVEYAPESGPFGLGDSSVYARWRARKLRHYPRNLKQQRVSITSPRRLSSGEREQIVSACRRANFALYRTDTEFPSSMEDLRAFGKRLGLVHFDRHLWAPKEGVVALRREVESSRARYIPYTGRAMKWHTDGYYNSTDDAVRGVIMHCVIPAEKGGANWLLDPEMVYIAVRDANPEYIEALMQPDVMTIPENSLEPGVHRPAVSGPVLFLDPAGGDLHMRYTARTRSIEWKDDAVTRDAVAFLEQLLTTPVSFAFRVRLEAGEGIVCNNVLHNREAFSDGADADRQRLFWRARYRDRIAGTSARRNGDR
jgi:hypothetical protein